MQAYLSIAEVETERVKFRSERTFVRGARAPRRMESLYVLLCPFCSAHQSLMEQMTHALLKKPTLHGMKVSLQVIRVAR